jgi:uncharacterized membrane protein
MASKSKRARQAAAKAKTKSAWPVIFWALIAAYFGYLQNRYGQFSDIRGFYGTRFMNGQHDWPYDVVTPLGGTGPLKPIEYPAISGVAIWLLTFITPQSGIPLLNYFGINALIHALFFAGTGYYIKKLTNNSTAYLFVLAPAAFMALNLNWDMWAVFPMVAAIYYFEKKRWTASAIILGIAIAAKFFPVVLLLPILIYFLREKQIKTGIKYFAGVIITWIVFNLPVALVSFDGWKYFYEFSFNRGLGDGSLYSVAGKIGLGQIYSNPLYYLLNITIFGLFVLFLLKNKINLSLAQTAFFTMFCFTYFGKQYSMQYVLWLAPLAVLAIASLPKKNIMTATYLYGAWQGAELLFRITYFQNWVSNLSAARGTPVANPVSDSLYGSLASFRYILVAAFVIYLVFVKSKVSTSEKIDKE